MTAGDGAELEDELKAQKRGLNPDGQQRESMGNAEKPASRLTSGGRGVWPARIPTLSRSVALSWASQVALVVKNPLADAGDVRDLGLTPGSGRPPGGGNKQMNEKKEDEAIFFQLLHRHWGLLNGSESRVNGSWHRRGA